MAGPISGPGRHRAIGSAQSAPAIFDEIKTRLWTSVVTATGLNERVHSVGRGGVEVLEPHGESNAGRCTDDGSLKADLSGGQRDGEVGDHCAFGRHAETAVDLTAICAEAADA